jgi:DNA-binding PadR family transcriptional regulator
MMIRVSPSTLKAVIDTYKKNGFEVTEEKRGERIVYFTNAPGYEEIPIASFSKIKKTVNEQTSMRNVNHCYLEYHIPSK